jgi:hypothetical protein
LCVDQSRDAAVGRSLTLRLAHDRLL